MGTWFKNMMSSSGEASSKRFCTVLCVLLLAFAFIADIFFNVTLDPVIIEPVKAIAMFGLGAIASEKILANLNFKSKPDEQV